MMLDFHRVVVPPTLSTTSHVTEPPMRREPFGLAYSGVSLRTTPGDRKLDVACAGREGSHRFALA